MGAPAVAGIEFTPPLPEWKAAAMARVAYGDAAKLAVPLTSPAPPSSVLSVPAPIANQAARELVDRGCRSAVLRRLQPFEVGLHYTDRHRLPAEEEEKLGVTFHPTVESLVAACERKAGHPPIGLANGWFYEAATQPSAFFDVTQGDNDLAEVGCCQATAGYDLASGLGVPNWAALPATLQTRVDPSSRAAHSLSCSTRR